MGIEGLDDWNQIFVQGICLTMVPYPSIDDHILIIIEPWTDMKYPGHQPSQQGTLHVATES